MIKYRAFALAAFILPLAANALNVGSVTTIIPADKQLVAKQLSNETDTGRLVKIFAQRINSPYSSGEVINFDSPSELLITPTRMIMPADSKNLVKIYYQGKSDNTERYYRLTFTDEPVSDNATEQTGKQAQALTRAVISTILVVQPRNKNLDFKYQNGQISNTGNVSWRITANGPCQKKPMLDKKKDCRDAFYVPPGKTYLFPTVDVAAKESYIGIWDIGKFIYVDKNNNF